MKSAEVLMNRGRAIKYPNTRLGRAQQGLVLVLVLLVILLLFLLLAFTWDRFFASSKDTIAANQSMLHYQDIRGELIYEYNRLKAAERVTGGEILQALAADGGVVQIGNPKPLGNGAGTLTMELQRLNNGAKNQPFENGTRPVIYGKCDGETSDGDGDETKDNRCHLLRLKAQAQFNTLAGPTFMTQMVGFKVEKW